ncbi:hypothetical protein F7Q91_03350 [Vibrio chagasii]|uniref:Bacterial type II secretion system protein E domain-containing protein n=1 Tax=Vibrio chagasii TaxID=170679 RepID=A0A7V7NWZ3_9VIBR|nr:ATPase, T2SS/T4P/T4SS family [Vibrio chagasii]KAB0482458.1 hypothetical protein F7Q91_03350 [Vibrio chagasii]
MQKKIPLLNVSSEMTDVEISQILWTAIDLNASDILIDYGYRVRVDVNGTIHEITDRTMQPNACKKILLYMLGSKASLLNSVNSAEPVFFAHITKNPDDKTKVRSFRVAALTSRSLIYGKTFKLVGRLNPDTPKNAQQLNIEPELVDVVQKNRKGIALFVGGTGTGKTTTMAGIIRTVLETPSNGKHILVFEDPPEISYEKVKKATGNSISVHEVGPIETDSDVLSFGSGLRTALRLRPNILVQGELRSKESIEYALNFSNTGHFLLATLHANSCKSAISRIFNMIDGDDKKAVLGSFINELSTVVAQILVHTIDGGRIAIRETVYLDSELRGHLLAAKTDIEIGIIIQQHLIERGNTFAQQLKNLYDNGIIAPESLMMEELV